MKQIIYIEMMDPHFTRVTEEAGLRTYGLNS